MHKIAMLTVGMIFTAGAALAGDAVEGVWQTAADDNGNYGHIQVSACGDKICGVLIKSFDSAGKPLKSENVGKQIIWDMVASGDGTYVDGKVWSPDRDKTYDSKMTLTGDSLAVKGCVLFICRDGGTWQRVN